jgi:hypothetical protein
VLECLDCVEGQDGRAVAGILRGRDIHQQLDDLLLVLGVRIASRGQQDSGNNAHAHEES